MKLLYAEDEPGLSEAVVDILTYYKYQVDAVDNGTDAVASQAPSVLWTIRAPLTTTAILSRWQMARS